MSLIKQLLLLNLEVLLLQPLDVDGALQWVQLGAGGQDYQPAEEGLRFGGYLDGGVVVEYCQTGQAKLLCRF